MRVISVTNVNEAFRVGLGMLRSMGDEEQSRAGPVIVYPSPVTTVYRRPMERILFSMERRANPYFHLFESMWMLAGRGDGQWLDTFVHDFSARFGEASGMIHGAYGRRWNSHWGFNQIACVIDILTRNPQSRQAVIQMWDPEQDLDPVGAPLQLADRPCNLVISFRIHHGVLDQTVFCRSNDIIWGAYGANAVHFSVLHEFIAAALGVGVGSYYQISNNYHAYKAEFDRICPVGTDIRACNLYGADQVQVWPLFSDVHDYDSAMKMLRGIYEWTQRPCGVDLGSLSRRLLDPMWRSWAQLKAGQPMAARSETAGIEGTDWRWIAAGWCQRAVDRLAARARQDLVDLGLPIAKTNTD